jgi:translation initiation factor 2 beta subunit (eIF-2beta)/eIF-5
MSEPEKQITPVPQNKSFARNVKKQKIINYLVNELKQLDSLDKNDVALLLRACEIIENKIKKKLQIYFTT